MIREIKTRLSLDGEREFKSAMADANREMRVMNADLKAMAAEFASTGDKQKYFTDRAETMGSKVKQQELIVEALQKAVKDSAQAYGEAARQTDDYRIRLSNATAKLFDMRRASEDANRELEALGRDSNKIGRQITNGIGDAAEDAGEKLDSMFERVQKDVNVLKTSVGFQVATEVGGFVVNAVRGVMGFVEENEELNRQLAITEYNISKYDFDWMTTLGLVSRATAITGNQEGALEAINNLVSTQVTNEELINAALEGILGVFITTGGALSLESLAEDARASVVNKEATGTYAEVLEELIQGVVIDDVNKALKATKNAEEALEIVTAYLTEAGFQTTTKSFEEQNKAYINAAQKRADLAIKWTALAETLTPAISGAIDATAEVVDGLNEIARMLLDAEFAKKQLKEYDPQFAEALEGGELDTWSGTWDYFIKNLIPSAGAETLTAENADPYEAGFQAMQQYNMGLQEAADAEVTAAQAAVATTIAQMQTEEQMEAAFEAGKNAMISFGNGIAEGAAIPINNVRDMVNAINNMMAQIATPAYGLGWSGVTGGNIYLYNAQRNNARNVSKMIGRGVQVEMLKS